MPIAPTRVDFHRSKYGPEILIDVAWIHDMPTFLHREPHSLSFYDITLVTKGRGRFWLDGFPYRVRAGQMLFTSPGQVRRWDVTQLDGLCLFFPATFLEAFFSDASFLQRLPFFQTPRPAAALQLSPSARRLVIREWGWMRRELLTWRRDSDHLLRARLYQELVRLAREYGETHDAPDVPVPHRIVSAFRRLVEERAPLSHGVAAYTRTLGVSAAHLTRLCKQHVGATAKELIEARLEILARRALLFGDRSAAQVAHDLGFNDPSYFARFFRRRTGSTPARFRAGRQLS